MRTGLVGDCVGVNAPAQQFRKDIGRIAEQADGKRLAPLTGVPDLGQRIIEFGTHAIQIAGFQAFADPARIALDGQHGRAGHGRGERLRTAHTAEPAGQDPTPGEITAEVFLTHGDEGLVGALHDALTADVNPGTGRHLPVHHQTLAVQFIKMLPVRPLGNQVGIGDQNARGVHVGTKDANRFAGLNQQGLVFFEFLEHRDDPVETLPVTCRAADTAIDHQRLRVLRDLRVEVIHQHAHWRLG